ncbi:GNAT family N-acetyltransferase [Sphingomonas crocodyli]|uniref:GNAT family N-acetyltransferase n=1 Tax=Sphingomonas crocodyli TaxID=1979270 RepID=UPI0019D124F1|nr:GNAT family N-acetyltransferase [Sphingomonas crocodyli]
MIEPVVIETDRLRLRQHRVDDLDACAVLGRDPIAVEFIYKAPLSREDVWHRLQRFAGHWALLGYGLFVVEEKATGRIIGEVGLADFKRGLGEDFDGAPEFAWVMSSDVHGKGYASEAAKAALGWIEVKMAPPRVVCIIDPENAASLRVAEKLGFRAYGSAEYKGKTVTKLERLA